MFIKTTDDISIKNSGWERQLNHERMNIFVLNWLQRNGSKNIVKMVDK